MLRATQYRGARGFSLLEAMIGLAVLSVGLIGMMKFQIFGITANNAGRRHTVATALAEELAAGLERLPFGDPLLASTGTPGPTAPTPFGRLVTGNAPTTAGAHHWSDTDQAVPNVRSATAAGDDYDRYWTVWGYTPSAGGVPVVKVVAVSVIYYERVLGIPREVVLYTQLNDPSTLISNIPANQ